jgi:tetratricopeptide (TPR) repeat protein
MAELLPPETPLAQMLRFLRQPGLPPTLLWVGAGASATAGFPALAEVAAALRPFLPPPAAPADDYSVVGAFETEYGRATLAARLHHLLGEPRPFAPLHAAIARLAAARVFSWLVTTNYDRLLENALADTGAKINVQALGKNLELGGLETVQVLKIHGDSGDWLSVVLTASDQQAFAASYSLVQAQLGLALRQRPAVYVGCSMTDPRLLDWLRGLPAAERQALQPGRAVLTLAEWERLGLEIQELLASANIRPVQVADHGAVSQLFAALAEELAPVESDELVLTLDPGEDEWTVTGSGLSPHRSGNPLLDRDFVALMAELRQVAAVPVSLDDPDLRRKEDALDAFARLIGERLTSVLLSLAACTWLAGQIARHSERGRPRLTLRVASATTMADRALALPWELLRVGNGEGFPVRDGALDLVREAVAEPEPGPELPPPGGPLTVAVAIAAPDGVPQVRVEEEALRLQSVLGPLGHKVGFAELGQLADLIKVVQEQRSSALHFSGHSLAGGLLFEDGLGLPDAVPVEQLVAELKTALGGPGEWPRLFFLAACHGEERSTAARLHRLAFPLVIGAFVPAGGAISTRAEATFYRTLAAGGTALQAAAQARRALSAELSRGRERCRYPLGWTQWSVYLRGEDRPLAVPGQRSDDPLPARFERREVEVSGLPLLQFGFIGRRERLHHIRRRIEQDGQRLFVLQGLGGLGKTALATHLLARVLAPGRPADQLILRCGGLDDRREPILALRRQAETHGEAYGPADWAERRKALEERFPDSAQGFAAVIRELRRHRPDLVLYADNVESLQEGPESSSPRAVGTWKPEAAAWWREMEQLAQDGIVLISTRYGWEGLDPDAWIEVPPLSTAEVLRMIDSFPKLAVLQRGTRERLARLVDGHPRMVQWLAGAVAQESTRRGRRPVENEWTDLIGPALGQTSSYRSEVLDEDLLLGHLWQRLNPEARTHAKAASVLRQPAPTAVLDALGGGLDELIRTSLLTLYRTSLFVEGRWTTEDRWALHSLVREFVASQVAPAERRAAHATVGAAYEAWLQKPEALWGALAEGIYHLHAINEGDRAWPMAQVSVLWLRHRARYREAQELLERCLEAGTSGDARARALLLLHQVRHRQGEHGLELDALLDQGLALATSEETRGLFLHGKGRLLSAQGRCREAEGLLREVLEILEKTQGREHPDYEMTLLTLGDVLSDQGRYGEAEGFLRQALAIADQRLSWDHPGASLHALAGVLQEQGRYGEAEALLRLAVAVRRELLGHEHPSYGESLGLLARVLARQDRYEEAEALLRQSLAVTTQALGPEHPAALRELLALAEVWTHGERGQEAEGLLRGVLTATKRALGSDEHPVYASALCALAEVLDKQGRYAEAEDLLRHAIGIVERTRGRFHPKYVESQQSLAEVLEDQGRLAEAEDLMRQSLVLLDEALGRESLEYGRALRGLARVLENQERQEEAEVLLRESLAITEAALGPDHPDLCPLLAALALNLVSRDHDQEGELLLVRALSLAEQAHGPDHPHVAQTLVLLCQVQRRLDRPEVVETAGRALAAMVKSLGPEHPRTQESVPFLWQILVDSAVRSALGAREAADRREIEVAISLQERAVGLIRQLGEEREILVGLRTLMFNLATFYRQAGRREDEVRTLEEVAILDERTGHEDLGSGRAVLEARQLAGSSPPEEESPEVWRQDLRQLEGMIASAASLAVAGRIAPASLRLQLQGMLTKLPPDGEGPVADFAAYIRAVAALLGGEPVPPVPAAYAFSITWIQERGLERRADRLSRLVAESEAAAERGDETAALAAYEEAVALARQAGEEREALIQLSILLFNLARLYQGAGRFADAVQALEEVVALDERTEYEELDADRAVLEAARQLAALGSEESESLAEG